MLTSVRWMHLFDLFFLKAKQIRGSVFLCTLKSKCNVTSSSINIFYIAPGKRPRNPCAMVISGIWYVTALR